MKQNVDSALLASTLEQAANSGLSAGGNGGRLFRRRPSHPAAVPLRSAASIRRRLDPRDERHTHLS